MVVGLLADSLAQIISNFAFVLPVFDILLEIVKHMYHLKVCTAVTRTFQ